MLVAFASLVQAQIGAFSPEVDTYVKVNAKLRLSFFASTTRESDARMGAELGPNLDLYFKPLVKLRRITAFSVDESKSRMLTLRVGYRHIRSVDRPTENRGLLHVTPRWPLHWGISLANRHAADFRVIRSDFSWRYGNRLALERQFAVGALRVSPYGQVEVLYDSRYSKWTRTTVELGSVFPIRRRMEIQPYWQHQNDTSTSPNRQTDLAGLSLSLYF